MKPEQVDFRVTFKQMDDQALINAEEYAALLRANGRDTIYHLLHAAPASIARPAIRRSKLVRWRAGDVREHMKQLDDHAPAGNRKGGRPRNVAAAAAS